MRNRRHAFRSPLVSGMVAAALLVAVPATAQQTLTAVVVPVDQARIITLTRDAGTIIIGNPGIAEATLIGPRQLVITGRSYGTTNLIVLDADGTLIADQLLTVQSSEQQVTVYRGAVRETLSCFPLCEPSLTVGDADASFNLTSQQVSTRSAIAEGQ